MHGATAVDGAGDAVHAHIALVGDRDLCNLSNDAAEALLQGDAAGASAWQVLVPAGLLRCPAQHFSVSLFISQHVEPELIGITPGTMRQFVHEGFHEEGVLGVRHAAPGAKWHMRRAVYPGNRFVGYGIGRVRRLCGLMLANVMVLPGLQALLAVQGSLEGAADGGPVVVVLDVFFTTPEGLYRHVEVLCNQSSL